MINYLSDRITNFCIDNEIIEIEFKEMFEYSIQTRLEEFITFTFMMLFIGSYLSIKNTLMFILSFMYLRKVSGGYHCETRLGCFIVSNLVTIINVLIGIELEEVKVITLVVIHMIAFIVIITLAPINHPNMNMSKSECIRNKKTLIWRICILTLLIVVLYNFNTTVAITGVLAIVSVSISLIVSKLVGQQVKIT